MKVDKELEQAIAKHGEASLPGVYQEEFYDKVDEKKKQIAA